MPELSMSAAIREAQRKILTDNPEAFLIGEDIGLYGGAFKISAGFIHEFGPKQVIDTPISEAGIVSVAAGAALAGSRPIVEIMFMDFMLLAFDGLINVAVKWEEIYGSEFNIPLIVRTPAGAGRSYGPTHSQSFEGMLMNVPKLVICAPSNPADAAGLLLGAYESERCVVFIEHKALYARKGQVPEALEPLPIGKGAVVRPGADIVLFAYGRHVATALQAANELATRGISAEVVDLRTVKPLDKDLIVERFSRAGRGMSLEESPVIGGVGGEIASIIMEEAFDYIEAPFVRMGAAEQAIPCSPALERECFPNLQTIVAQAEATCAY